MAVNKISLFFFLAVIALAFSACSDHKQDSSSVASNPTQDVLQKESTDTANKISGVFEIPELKVTASPAAAQSISVNPAEKVIDYDISPAGPIVAAVISDASQNYSVKFWQIGQPKLSDSCSIEKGFKITAIAWHPRATSLFLIGIKDQQYHILKIEKGEDGWLTKSIFSTPNECRRLVPCPRPFIVGNAYSDTKESYSYRLFFGMATEDHSFRIVSITESGKRMYQVIGPKKTFSTFDDADGEPSTMEAPWALPIAFHPAGHELIWEDNKNNFFVADYARRWWGNSQAIPKNLLTGGSITPTPNGLGFLHWKQEKPGIGLFLFSSGREEQQANQLQFISTPSSVPDGKGIVGLTNTNGKFSFNYVPITVPLADVVNAWMYIQSPAENNLFQKNSGLFRSQSYEQLYMLYDTENYDCDGYDQSSPTRPYMVTTDVFWELFASAYEGLFIVKERENAMPDFWNFIKEADKYYKQNQSKSAWANVMGTLAQLNAGTSQNAEIIKMQKAEDKSYSDVLKKDFNYTELKPRGHYTSSEEMKNYFMAFNYFTTAFNDEPATMQELNSLPPEIRNYAVKWIGDYSGFISPSRTPLVWKDMKNNPPAYNQNPGTGVTLFPLSWGIDNEILYSTVYHPNLPADRQITGPGGQRLLPSGLDLAAALGNNFAASLLESDYKNYPPLRKVIGNLKDNFNANGKTGAATDNLYGRWLSALAVQWADTVTSPNGGNDKNLWQAKRLQTGLASWATLRHATVLVNERTAAECGEGGFEDILLRAPRGYVEPDPNTFAAIADLFETAIKYVPESIQKVKGDNNDEKTLYDGILKRLKETAKDARMFQAIAEKEKKGEAITADEYESILYLGRIAEHYFLIYNSLANKDYALSTPDPMPKIADVAGNNPYLMAAVGNSLEWDNVVPFYGRHEIVKGAVYSYYEFSSDQLLNDKEWQQQVKNQVRIPWLQPYLTEEKLTFPAETNY